jgi:hypothetical protein
VLCQPLRAEGQSLRQRGFVEGRGVLFPQDTVNDAQNALGDLLAREEVFATPADWLELAGGVDVRGNTHDEVERSWRVDIRDRGLLRPAMSVRRLGATLTRGPFTIDVGKQFIRWGKADIVTPTDRLAPRDLLNVVDDQFLAVTGARAVWQSGPNTIDVAWVPLFTPSRLPLLDQRWTAVRESSAPVALVDATGNLPAGPQTGVRWNRMASGYEYSVSFFDGYNHFPNISVGAGAAPFEVAVSRTYPRLRSYGADAAVPTRWFTVKGEAAYFTSSSPETDEYVLYVVQLERQTGEWLLIGGYAGQVVTAGRARFTFAPDRGLTRALLARVSYTIDANRSTAFEAAVRETGRGVYVKGEFSEARGQHWRLTLGGALIAGRSDDFLGQYRRNSHLTAAARYSF